jgi:hypothetical protein
MANPEAILQFARLVGRDVFYAGLGFPPGQEPPDLDVAQREQLRVLIDNRFDGVVDALIAEAMASDDVHDQDSAVRYLHDRLDFLSDLLTADQRTRLTAACEVRVSLWGSTGSK